MNNIQQPASSPPPSPPQTPPINAGRPSPEPNNNRSFLKVVLLILILLAVMAILSLGGYFAYKSLNLNSNSLPKVLGETTVCSDEGIEFNLTSCNYVSAGGFYRVFVSFEKKEGDASLINLFASFSYSNSSTDNPKVTNETSQLEVSETFLLKQIPSTFSLAATFEKDGEKALCLVSDEINCDEEIVPGNQESSNETSTNQTNQTQEEQAPSGEETIPPPPPLPS